MTTTGGWLSDESANGKYLYYKNTDPEVGLWKMPVGGGPRSKVLDGVKGRLFTVTERGIYFNAGHPTVELRFFDFASNSIRAISPVGQGPGATISSDERWAVYARNVYLGANLMVVENLH